MSREFLFDFKIFCDDHLPLMGNYEALYARIYKSFMYSRKVGEATLLRSNLDHEAMEEVHLIKDRLNPTKGHQKCYAHIKKRDLDFEMDDFFSKIVTMNRVNDIL